MASARVSVPATTANLGPGYDCLGIALNLANRVTVTSTLAPGHLLEGPVPAQSMAEQAVSAFFKEAARPRFNVQWSIEGEIPTSRGLGSSVTVRLGLLGALNALTDSPLSIDDLFRICATLEGHPDNAAPAAFGGFTVASGGRVARFPVPDHLSFILLIPSFEVSTPEARKVLPASLDRLSAVQSSANACRITAAFALQKPDLLKDAFQDGFHQPFRKPLIPFLDDVIQAGTEAGALGGFLSGSGSTICCISDLAPEPIAAAMRNACPSPSDVRIETVTADNTGLRVLD
jgi:homoserine kinase